MKSMFKPALVACMALAIGLVGCQNEPVVDGPEKTGTKSVAIKIADGDLTRAAGEAAGVVLDDPTTPDVDESETLAVEFNDGALYFAADNTNIVKMVNILKALPTGQTALGANEVLLSTLQSADGATFTNLPKNVSAVYFAANLPVAAGDQTGAYDNFTTVAGLKTAVIGVANLGDFNDIPIFGFDDALTEDGTEEDAIVDANIEAKVVAARFEIGTIAAATGASASIPPIKSFTLAGIYLDNIYTAVQLGGAVSGDLYGAEAARQDGVTPTEAATFPYPGTHHISGLTYDAPALTGQNNYTATYDDPATEDVVETLAGVWGYNLPAPVAVVSSVEVGVATLPNIVIKLTDVVLDDVGNEGNGTNIGTKYLTLRQKDTDPATEGNQSDKLEPGNVYKVTDFTFNASDLTDYPYEGAKDINVEVSILPWTGVEVEYDFW